ncbi:hypothetical protein Q1695_002458 [Nippostrongylus brasiliensis]|nr:hypothetical protein Q1695_002458 [Nippostrongylus brasiliensis]
MSSPSTQVTLLAVLCVVCLSAAQNSESFPSEAKRGGARAFHGYHGYYSIPSSKRLSAASPYYLYEKRGGGRAFVGAWQPYDSIGSRFYENPYYKRSSNLWEFLEDRNAL